MEGDKDSAEAKAAAALKQRSDEAQVAKLEAEVADKQADAKLRMAKVEKEIADADSINAETQAGTSGTPDPQAQQAADIQEREFRLKQDAMIIKKDWQNASSR
jgi:hypothetical protein